MTTRKAFRAAIYHCVADPGRVPAGEATRYFEDGLLVVEDGKIADVGPAEELLPALGDAVELEDLQGKLIRRPKRSFTIALLR